MVFAGRWEPPAMMAQTMTADHCPQCGVRQREESGQCERCGAPLAAWRGLLELPSALRERGTQLMGRGSYEDALECFAAARLIAPGSRRGQKRMLTCLIKLGQYQRAMDKMVHADREDPAIARLWDICVRALDQQESDLQRAGWERQALEESIKRLEAERSALLAQLGGEQTAAPQGAAVIPLPASTAKKGPPVKPRTPTGVYNPNTSKKKKKKKR